MISFHYLPVSCSKNLNFEWFNSLKLTYSSSFEESEVDRPPIDERQVVAIANGRCWTFGKASSVWIRALAWYLTMRSIARYDARQTGGGLIANFWAVGMCAPTPQWKLYFESALPAQDRLKSRLGEEKASRLWGWIWSKRLGEEIVGIVAGCAVRWPWNQEYTMTQPETISCSSFGHWRVTKPPLIRRWLPPVQSANVLSLSLSLRLAFARTRGFEQAREVQREVGQERAWRWRMSTLDLQMGQDSGYTTVRLHSSTLSVTPPYYSLGNFT